MFFVYLFISISLIFFSLSVLGFYRFPDVYTRIHSAGLATTFGFIFFALAAVAYLIFVEKLNYSLMAHIILAVIILLIVEPGMSHSISRAAYKKGIRPDKF